MTEEELEAHDKRVDKENRKKEKHIEKLASGKSMLKYVCYFVLFLVFVGMVITGIIHHHHKYVRTMVGYTWSIQEYVKGRPLYKTTPDLYIQDQDTAYMSVAGSKGFRTPIQVTKSGHLITGNYGNNDPESSGMNAKWLSDKSTGSKEVFEPVSTTVKGKVHHISSATEKKDRIYTVLTKE